MIWGESLQFELKKQKIYKKVFQDACDKLLSSEIEERLQNAGLDYQKTGKGYTLLIPFFDDSIRMEIPEFSFKSIKGSNITLVSKIIILHYINYASGEPLGKEQASYEDIPGCRHYQPVFEKRVIKPLLNAFGGNRDAFSEAGSLLGGKKEEYGDASFTIYPLPRIPLTFILWEADQEFPPLVKILFDISIDKYLPLEDITVISKLAATRIIKAARLIYSEESIQDAFDA